MKYKEWIDYGRHASWLKETEYYSLVIMPLSVMTHESGSAKTSKYVVGSRKTKDKDRWAREENGHRKQYIR